jgi:hypothetical protein
VDEFTQAYIECALWSSTDDNDDPLDDKYTPADLDRTTLAAMVDDCQRFQDENAEDIDTWPTGNAEEMAGYDFWLTRNGHGAGFWDGDWGEDVGERLTTASKAFGEFYLCVGDDGKIYS